MNAWPFVIAAYALTLAGTAGLLAWSWLAMRAAESHADSLKRER
jgi:Flp pilus assembly protein CpaB